jgi:hypothetical protein
MTLDDRDTTPTPLRDGMIGEKHQPTRSWLTVFIALASAIEAVLLLYSLH